MSPYESCPSRLLSAHRGAELALDLGQIAPDLLALDLAVAKLEHVEEAETDGPALTVAQERRPVIDLAVPHRLVDQEVVSVETADRRDVLAVQSAEQHL